MEEIMATAFLQAIRAQLLAMPPPPNAENLDANNNINDDPNNNQ